MVVTLVSFLPVFNKTNNTWKKKSFDFVRQRMLESIELCASSFNFLSFGILYKWIWSVSREWEAKLHRFIRANGIFLNFASFLLWFVPQFFVHIVWYTNAIEAFHWRCASTETAKILWFWCCINTDRKWSLFLTIPGSLVLTNTIFDLFFSQLLYYSFFHWSEIAVFLPGLSNVCIFDVIFSPLLMLVNTLDNFPLNFVDIYANNSHVALSSWLDSIVQSMNFISRWSSRFNLNLARK